MSNSGWPPKCSIASRMPPQPGDVISTGTPPGAGPGQKPPVCLKGGEVMRPGIEGLGEQARKVVQA